MDAGQVQRLYHLADLLDADGIAGQFSDHAVLELANSDRFTGPREICENLASFFAELDGLHHEIQALWRVPGGYVVEAIATFNVRGWPQAITRHGVVVIEATDGKVGAARIYYDLQEVWDAIADPDRVFEGLDASFPASDPPAWTP